MALVTPGYPAYRNTLRAMGLVPVELRCGREHGFRPTAAMIESLDPALAALDARAELQYVRIYTSCGNALILGALKDVAERCESGGQLVHRSWWIANAHVRTLRRRGTRCLLTLSNGLEVPVSRRRQQALINQFGSSTTLN